MGVCLCMLIMPDYDVEGIITIARITQNYIESVQCLREGILSMILIQGPPNNFFFLENSLKKTT